MSLFLAIRPFHTSCPVGFGRICALVDGIPTKGGAVEHECPGKRILGRATGNQFRGQRGKGPA